MSTKDVTLKSGARLKITLAPFADAKALYQAVLKELKDLKLGDSQQIESVLKDALCIGFSSKEIDERLEVCLRRVLYNDLKIDEDTFEPEKARGDYLPLIYEVMKANIDPFLKSLYAQWLDGLGALRGIIQGLESMKGPIPSSSPTSDSATPATPGRSRKRKNSTPG